MGTIDVNDTLHPADLDALYADIFSEVLFQGGGETVGRRVSQYGNTGAPLSQSLRLVGFRCRRTEIINQMAFCSGNTAAGATPSLIRYGLYLRTDDGLTYNLVASTPHDATLFVGVNARYPKALSAPYTKIRGKEYLAGCLIVSAAAMPSFTATDSGTALGNFNPFLQLPIRAGNLAGQADLPANFLGSSLTGSAITPVCELLP